MSTPDTATDSAEVAEVAEILDNFDFGRVHRVMQFLEWKWATINPDSSNPTAPVYLEYTPTLAELRTCLRKLIVEADSQLMGSPGRTSLGRGGFYVTVIREADNPKLYIDATFQLTSWDNCD